MREHVVTPTQYHYVLHKSIILVTLIDTSVLFDNMLWPHSEPLCSVWRHGVTPSGVSVFYVADSCDLIQCNITWCKSMWWPNSEPVFSKWDISHWHCASYVLRYMQSIYHQVLYKSMSWPHSVPQFSMYDYVATSVPVCSRVSVSWNISKIQIKQTKLQKRRMLIRKRTNQGRKGQSKAW